MNCKNNVCDEYSVAKFIINDGYIKILEMDYKYHRKNI